MFSDHRSHALSLMLAVLLTFAVGLLASMQQTSTTMRSKREVLLRDSRVRLNLGDVRSPENGGWELPKPIYFLHESQPSELLFPVDVERAMLIEGVNGGADGSLYSR